MYGSVPAASEAVSVVVGPIEVRDVSKAAELLAALQAVRDGALSEGRVSEYDVYVTNIDGVVCNDKSNSALREAGPYFLREIYPTKAAQDAHGKDSEALGAFRTAKGVLADFKNPDRAVDIPRATVSEGKVVSEGEFLAAAELEQLQQKHRAAQAQAATFTELKEKMMSEKSELVGLVRELEVRCTVWHRAGIVSLSNCVVLHRSALYCATLFHAVL